MAFPPIQILLLSYSRRKKPSIASVNAHFDPWRLLPADQNAAGTQTNLLTTVDIVGSGKLAGAFTAAGLNILSAQIFTRNDGIVLDTFFVTDAHTGLLANKAEREAFEEILEKIERMRTETQLGENQCDLRTCRRPSVRRLSTGEFRAAAGRIRQPQQSAGAQRRCGAGREKESSSRRGLFFAGYFRGRRGWRLRSAVSVHKIKVVGLVRVRGEV